MSKIPKITFKAMDFNENIDMIAMFIYIEKNKDSSLCWFSAKRII